MFGFGRKKNSADDADKASLSDIFGIVRQAIGLTFGVGVSIGGIKSAQKGAAEELQKLTAAEQAAEAAKHAEQVEAWKNPDLTTAEAIPLMKRLTLKPGAGEPKA